MAIIKIRNAAIDLDAAEIPNLPASKITSGTFANDKLTGSGAITINGSAVALGASTTIETGLSWQSTIVTASTLAAVSGNGYWINTTSNACTITLPANPSLGDEIVFVDYARNWATNAITINTNSKKFQGNTSPNPVYNTSGQSVSIVYSDATKGWIPTVDDDVTLETPQNYDIDFLVVAGAGGGGSFSTTAANESGGGGGAGGFRTSTQTGISTGTVITVTVGDGGAGGASSTENGFNGSDSSISGSGLTTITSAGGGGGGRDKTNGLNGGSGGGGGSEISTTGGSGNTPSTTPSQGNDGGNGASGRSGGGGGATAVGSGGGSGSGDGGAGTANSITGSSVTYAGGGGGGGYYYSSKVGGTGGTGGGGTGANPNAPTVGTVNTGSGGGGGGWNNGTSFFGAAGGKGVVILSVPTANYSSTTTGSPTVTTSGSNTIIQFNGTGSYTS